MRFRMRDDTVWASDGSGRIFGTAEEWKPCGIMAQIHPGAGSEGGIKKNQTPDMGEDRRLSLIIAVGKIC